jgi:hypothetical protein
MKAEELRKYAVCSICRKKLGETGLPLFYKVTIERFGIDLAAVNRQAGLEQMIGNPRIAQAMGTDSEMTVKLLEPTVLSICEPCSTDFDRPRPIAALAELPSVDEA